MERNCETESCRADHMAALNEERREVAELTAVYQPSEGQAQQEMHHAAEEALQRQVRDCLAEENRTEQDDAWRQLDDGRTMESVRSSLSNFRQSASRTTGQIRELLETSKALDHDLVSFLQDPQTRAFLEGMDDEEDEDNNLMDIGDEASSDNPKEIEALKQKTKSLKRKLRKWRKAARMALSEICPDISADAQGDMTPGTMKNVLQKIRQLKSLTDRQTSIILNLTGQCEAQKSESEEKDALIMELLRNCNGIRPALVKGDQPSEKTSPESSSLEGVVTKREPIDYPLISASEVESVLAQNSIRFGSVDLIPSQINCDRGSDGATGMKADNSTAVDNVHSLQVGDSEPAGHAAMSADYDGNRLRPPSSVEGMRQVTGNQKGNVWWGVAVGTAAAFGSILMGNLSRRQRN